VRVVLRSSDVSGSESERHDVNAGVAKGFMPQSCVNRRRANTFVSNEGSELTGEGLKMWEIVVLDEDEAPILVIGFGLSNGGVIDDDVVPLAEMLMRDDDWRAALGHVGNMGGPSVDLVGRTILVGKVEFD
jgi:hypothetical protein